MCYPGVGEEGDGTKEIRQRDRVTGWVESEEISFAYLVPLVASRTRNVCRWKMSATLLSKSKVAFDKNGREPETAPSCNRTTEVLEIA